jgi:hypothetical protein
MRVEITEVHPESYWVKFGREKEVLGKVFTIINIYKANGRDGYYSASFVDNSVGYIYGFKYIEVPEPSAMSELSTKKYQESLDRLNDVILNILKPAPKKLSWIQKIRGYDDLQARCNSAEAMRDYYKESLDSWESVAISKARDCRGRFHKRVK